MSLANGYLNDWSLDDSAFSSIENLHKDLINRPVPDTVRGRLGVSDWDLELLSEFQEQLSGYAINTLGLRYINLDEAGRKRAFKAYDEMRRSPKFLPKKCDVARRRWVGMALCAGLAMAKWDKDFEGAHREKTGRKTTECSTEHNYLDCVTSYLTECIERASEAPIHIDGVFEPQEILRSAQIILNQMVEPDKCSHESQMRRNFSLIDDGRKALEWFKIPTKEISGNCVWAKILAEAYGTTASQVVAVKRYLERKDAQKNAQKLADC